MLGTSRGPQKVPVMVDFLVQKKIDVLFTIGGDGTQKGALEIESEIARRGLKIGTFGSFQSPFGTLKRRSNIKF